MSGAALRAVRFALAEARQPLALAAFMQPSRRDYRRYRDQARARAAQR